MGRGPQQDASVRAIAIVVSAALFLEILDVTIVAIALPEIGHSLGVDALSLGSTITYYILGLAMFLPGSSWVADRFGAKQTFVFAVMMFSISSAACGLATEFWHLLAGRFFQGVFAALMVPVGRALLLQRAEGTDLVKAMIWFTLPALIAPVIAPLIGAVITAYAGWRWIFFVNIPICLIGVVAGARILPETQANKHKTVDPVGWILLAVGFSTLLIAFEFLLGERTQVGVGIILAVIGLVLIGVYLRFRRLRPSAVLTLRPFADQIFTLTQVSSVVFRLGLGSVPILWPLMLQVGWNVTVLEAGLATSPLAIGALLARGFVSRSLKWFGFRWLMILSTSASAFLLAAVCFWSVDTPLWILSIYIFTLGVLRSLQLTALNSLCYVGLEKEDLTEASTVSSMVLQFSLAISVSIGFFVIACFAGTEDAKGIQLLDFQLGFLVLSGIALLSLLPIIALSKDAGDVAAGR